MDLVFAWDATRKAGDQPAVRQAIQHRQFFGEPQRFVQRQQVAVDQELEILVRCAAAAAIRLGEFISS